MSVQNPLEKKSQFIDGIAAFNQNDRRQSGTEDLTEYERAAGFYEYLG